MMFSPDRICICIRAERFQEKYAWDFFTLSS
jgi:hypothetical protein